MIIIVPAILAFIYFLYFLGIKLVSAPFVQPNVIVQITTFPSTLSNILLSWGGFINPANPPTLLIGALGAVIVFFASMIVIMLLAR